MLGRIYTFERVQHSDSSPIVELVSPAVLRAITLAMHRYQGIRFEELTEFDNPHPMVVVLFPRRDMIDRFDRELARLLRLSGIDLKVMSTSVGYSDTSNRDFGETHHAA